MTYKIFIINDAEEDILEIYNYVANSDSHAKALRLLSEIEKKCKSLSDVPERGNYPPELERIGIHDFREIHYKPYRIIYRVIKSSVYIHCILDGRRNLNELLENRLLR
ncbi:MAG: type II toxin-antitoxin system RelE/ParE family toxin [Bacteroidetes bacterium]|nr:MAG: type II toxin-antitoxin system RelE/ParE family toxin [Bacteroidota bacterium]